MSQASLINLYCSDNHEDSLDGVAVQTEERGPRQPGQRLDEVHERLPRARVPERVVGEDARGEGVWRVGLSGVLDPLGHLRELAIRLVAHVPLEAGDVFRPELLVRGGRVADEFPFAGRGRRLDDGWLDWFLKHRWLDYDWMDRWLDDRRHSLFRTLMPTAQRKAQHHHQQRRHHPAQKVHHVAGPGHSGVVNRKGSQ